MDVLRIMQKKILCVKAFKKSSECTIEMIVITLQRETMDSVSLNKLPGHLCEVLLLLFSR